MLTKLEPNKTDLLSYHFVTTTPSLLTHSPEDPLPLPSFLYHMVVLGHKTVPVTYIVISTNDADNTYQRIIFSVLKFALKAAYVMPLSPVMM